MQDLQQAQLQIEGHPPLNCLFNPKDYTVTKSNTWNFKQQAGVGLPKLQFGGGAPQELSFELLFDSLEGPPKIATDIEQLLMVMEADSQFARGKATARPPYVTFSWGPAIFKGAVKSLSVQYLRFDKDGNPLRAQVKLSLIQAEKNDSRSAPPGPVKSQNPTTRAAAAPGVHTVRDGDSLQSIAYGAYGDATVWRLIAEANEIDNPLALRRGTRLTIPALGA
jgi:Contractile injection system tube protein/LysM domain